MKTHANGLRDLESQSPLPEPSPPGAFDPTSNSNPRDIGPSEEVTISNVPAILSSEPSPATKPKVGSTGGLNGSGSPAKTPANASVGAEPIAETAADSNAAPPKHISEDPVNDRLRLFEELEKLLVRAREEAKGGEILSEYDEPLFEDTPEFTFWKAYVKLAEERDSVLVEGWNKSMDVLLIFAGLFSAIVTAFLIEAYKNLSEDNTATNNTLLRQISVSMGNAQPEGSLLLVPFKASRSAIRVNCMWFTSLIISLSATVVTVLAKQWIDDYDDYKKYPGDSRKRGQIRQSRYTNLLQWGIPTIIESLPTLLLIALGLFFIGLVDFLWAIDVTVATTSIVFIAAITLFFLLTTLLPAFAPRCAYKTPLSSLFLMVRTMARLYYEYACCLSRFLVKSWKDPDTTWATLWTKLQADGGTNSASTVLSRFHFISGWRTVIRQAEEEYVASTIENINARAIAWLIESSTNEAHVHAAIRATASLALDGEPPRILEDAGVGDIAVSRAEALYDRLRADDPDELKVLKADDAMILIARQRHASLAKRGYLWLGDLSEHEDANIACLFKCTIIPSLLGFGNPIFALQSEHMAALRKRVLITAFDTLKHQMLEFMRARRDGDNPVERDYGLDPKTIDFTLPFLLQGLGAWFRGDKLDGIDRAILSMWQCQPGAAAQPMPRSFDGAQAMLSTLAAFLTPESSDERCTAVSDAISELDIHSLLATDAEHGLPLLRDMHNLLVRALVSVERPSRMWTSTARTLHYLHWHEVRSPYGDGPDFALACARFIMQNPEFNATYYMLSTARQPFWDALSECNREGSDRQLRNIGQSLLILRLKDEDGGLKYAEEILKSSFLSTAGNHIHSLYPTSKLDFDDEDFLVLLFFTDLSARLYLTEGSKVIDSGIESSLAHSWGALTRVRGQEWLDERIAFWQVHEPALWKGDTDEARLSSLMERCRATGCDGNPLLGQPGAYELLLASHITIPSTPE